MKIDESMPKLPNIEDDEIWRDIDGYNGFYQVSTHGRVRSWRNGKHGKRDKPIIIGKCRSSQYRIVHLHGDVKKSQSVHKLVAEAFIPNPENKPYVKHMDNNKENNHIMNLKWSTKTRTY